MYGSQYCNVNLKPVLLNFRIYLQIQFFKKNHIVDITTIHVGLLSQSYQNANQLKIIG